MSSIRHSIRTRSGAALSAPILTSLALFYSCRSYNGRIEALLRDFQLAELRTRSSAVRGALKRELALQFAKNGTDFVAAVGAFLWPGEAANIVLAEYGGDSVPLGASVLE